MLILYFSIYLLVAKSLSVGLKKPCGPLNQCVCATKENALFVTLDCSSSNVLLSDVCKFASEHANVSVLKFNSNRLNLVKQQDLHGCMRIKELFLRNNSILYIEKNALLTLKELTFLDISSNNLKIYDGKRLQFLQGLAQLKELGLNGNLIQRSGANATPHAYPNLIDAKKLETLFIDGLFAKNINYPYLEKLSFLRLSGMHGYCNLGELTNDTFKMVPQLKKLDISNCKITNIYAGTFSMLHQLTWLDASSNMELGFSPLRNISYSLQFTSIDFLNLTKLHPTFSRCSKITRHDVCYMRNTTLREVVLDSNKIEIFDSNMALLMPDTLQILRARDNTFTFGSYLLQCACLANLTILDMAFQNKPHAPLQYLTEPVDISTRLQYPTGNCTYDNPEYLKKLSLTRPGCPYLDSDNITERDLYQFSMPRTLKSVSFHDSNMKYRLQRYIVQPFDNNIEYIDISGNILYEWSGPIGPFLKLKTVNVSRNYCSKIEPDIFRYLPQLKRLQAENNYLGIPLAKDVNGTILTYLKNLKYLDLSSNLIRFLPPKVFKNLYNLRFLNLSFNNLDHWTLSAGSIPKLRYLDIQSNALAELPKHLVAQFNGVGNIHPSTFRINMNNNPIKCSCKQKHFLQWMVSKKSSFIEFHQYTFIGDSGNVLTARDCEKVIAGFDKACQSYTWLIILCSISLTLFISLIIAGLVYKHRWKLRYFLFMNRRRFFGFHSNADYHPIENYKYDAFISYAEENIRFVLDGIIPQLELSDMTLCIHQRDFIAGNAVTENIIDAIQSGRRTVVVLSKAFLKSKWCLYEFHMARMEGIYSREGRSCLIIVMLETMLPNRLMPLEMIELIKQESFIEFTQNAEGNVLFWENLKQAILH